MRRKCLVLIAVSVVLAVCGVAVLLGEDAPARAESSVAWAQTVNLPAPKLKGPISLEEAINGRRTVRSFADRALSLEQLSQLLWAAQGITDQARSLRAVPSAGATYPIEVYVACGSSSVKGLQAGVWRYNVSKHSIYRVATDYRVAAKDQREELAKQSRGQMWAAQAPVTFAIVCQYERTTGKYGERGKKYVHYEAGNASQNIFLQCESLGLSAGIIGAFTDEEVSSALNLPKDYEPLLLMPVGYKKEK